MSKKNVITIDWCGLICSIEKSYRQQQQQQKSIPFYKKKKVSNWSNDDDKCPKSGFPSFDINP